ncbi:MAG TPA: ABC transporter permease [Geminicoccaceae bacterium]
MCSSGRSCGFRAASASAFRSPAPCARAALSYALELRLERQLIIAALRMTVQLLLVGLVVLMHQDISLML